MDEEVTKLDVGAKSKGLLGELGNNSGDPRWDPKEKLIYPNDNIQEIKEELDARGAKWSSEHHWNSCSAAACRSWWMCFFAIHSKTKYTSAIKYQWPTSKTTRARSFHKAADSSDLFCVQRLLFPEPANHKNLEVASIQMTLLLILIGMWYLQLLEQKTIIPARLPSFPWYFPNCDRCSVTGLH